MYTRQAKQGFTLIELLIVIAIIGLLATLAIVSLTTAQRKARDTKRIADIKQLQNAVELYYSEQAAYPLSAAAVNDSWAEFGTVISTYITNIPIDPQNNATNFYTYGGIATEYFIGAKLEANDHDALDGDDDTAYAAAVGVWANLDVVRSTDVGDNASAVTSFDCGSVAAPDAANGIYCVSE